MRAGFLRLCDEDSCVTHACRKHTLWRREQGVDRSARQTGAGRAVIALTWHGQAALAQAAMAGHVHRRGVEQGVQSGQAARAAAGARAALLRQIIAQRAAHRGVQSGPRQQRRRLGQPVRRQAHAQAKGVAGAGDRMRTGPRLAQEPRGADGCSSGRKGVGHRPNGSRLGGCSRRWGAKARHAGVARRDQEGSLTLPCPREGESAGTWRSPATPAWDQCPSVWSATRWRTSCKRGPWLSRGPRQPIWRESRTNVARTAQRVEGQTA